MQAEGRKVDEKHVIEDFWSIVFYFHRQTRHKLWYPMIKRGELGIEVEKRWVHQNIEQTHGKFEGLAPVSERARAQLQYLSEEAWGQE